MTQTQAKMSNSRESRILVEAFLNDAKDHLCPPVVWAIEAALEKATSDAAGEASESTGDTFVIATVTLAPSPRIRVELLPPWNFPGHKAIVERLWTEWDPDNTTLRDFVDSLEDCWDAHLVGMGNQKRWQKLQEAEAQLDTVPEVAPGVFLTDPKTFKLEAEWHGWEPGKPAEEQDELVRDSWAAAMEQAERHPLLVWTDTGEVKGFDTLEDVFETIAKS